MFLKTVLDLERADSTVAVTRVLQRTQSPGDTSTLATPVPIPNTAVKQRWADDTWRQPAPGKVGGRRDPALF